MKYNIGLSVRWVWPLAIAFITLSLPFSYGSDPKIFQIPLSDVDISIQITRKAQVGESIETRPSAIGKPTQVDTPKVLRHPDAIYGSSLFRPAAGGEALIYSGDNRQVIAITPEQLILGSSNSMSANETFKVPCSWSWDGHQFVRRDDLFGKEMGHASTIHAITTSSDGSLCAAESSSTIRFWDLKQKQSVGQEMSDHSNRITDMKFSPDGKYLASVAWDGTVRIWEVPSGRRRLIMDADVAGISSLAFLPDGSLITANGNGTVHLWNLPKHLLEN